MANKKKKSSGNELMNVKNVAEEWDAYENVRARVREGGPLLHPESGEGEDIKTCVLNKEILTPMVLRMVHSPKKGHPPIDDLRDEVSKIFTMSKRVPLPSFDDMQKLAWRIRHLVCFVKTKARRKEPSTELLLHVR